MFADNTTTPPYNLFPRRRIIRSTDLQNRSELIGWITISPGNLPVSVLHNHSHQLVAGNSDDPFPITRFLLKNVPKIDNIH